jgi:hypothetical protein
VEGGAIINVSQVVDALLPYFKICYERSLAQNGRFGAWISLTATVDARGRVVGVKGSGDDGVPHDMMRCLEGVVVQALFAPPVGGVATVALDLSFTVPPNYVLSNPS